MKVLITIIIVWALFTGMALAADMKEIEAIRAEVGQHALIIPVPHYNCRHIYLVKKSDGSIWIYRVAYTIKSKVIHKALIFLKDKQGEKQK